ncbi:MAG TPA: hypothetical protein VH852_06005 [Hyphomicrobium sp.]|jgi:hypothetical protein
MTGGEKSGGGRKTGAAGRAERLAAELKANLKKRKEQARARQRPSGAEPSAAPAKGKPES